MRSKYKNILSVLFISLFFFYPDIISAQDSREKVDFIAPVDLNLLLSGNFAEVRSNHFHSGIDIKTDGKTGIPVKATANGYVSRIKIEPGGYGKAIYMRHPNGYTSVYGHLSALAPELRDYVIKQQYRRKSFRVDLYPEAGKFKFNRGDVIGKSGNTGSSMGPHLHFEIRDTQTENPVNPLLFPFRVVDNRPPVINSINFYSLNGRKGLKKPLKYKASGSNGRYYISAKNPVPVDSKFGIGIESIDYLNGSSNKCGIFEIKLFVEDTLYFHSMTDEFSFAESRYINSFIDYREYQEDRHSLYRTYLLPNNNLSVLQYTRNKGVIQLRDDKPVKIHFEVKDVAGNTSKIGFEVRKDTAGYETEMDQLPFYSAYFHFEEDNEFVDSNIRINIPAKALYDNLYFNYETEPGSMSTFSRVHKVHDSGTPLHKSYQIRIKPDSLPAELKPYAVIAGIDGKDSFSIGGKWEGEYLLSSTRSFGNFAIMVDTIAPLIIPRNFNSGRDIPGREQIRFTVRDDFSGISKITGKIDGEWALFEWDPKNQLIFHDFEHRPIDKTKPHLIEIEVIDGVGNKGYYSIKTE